MRSMTPEQRTLADAAQANKLNIIHHAYVDIAGDLIAGSLLGQILFWFGRGKDGTSRAKIRKDGHLWVAKARADWWDEIRITPKQYDRAAKILRDKGFIELRTMKFNGNPTTHIRIVPDKINEALDDWKWKQVGALSPDGEQPYPQEGKNDVDLSGTTVSSEGEARCSQKVNDGITERCISSYTENTPDITAQSTLTEGPAEPAACEHPDITSHRQTVEALDADFEAIWAEYPKKEGKQRARQAFMRAVRGMGARKPDGSPWTAEEILAEVVLYRQHVERMVRDGELTYRYIPSGGSWFEREGWADEIPSISSSFDDFDQASEYNRNVMAIRSTASRIGRASDDRERREMRLRLSRLMSALPY